jgi:predicted  nucleic acid-binding Zn-ribbon protein
LHQQSARVAGETAQLREMLLDLLNEQEAVAMRQAQLGASLSTLQGRLEALAQNGGGARTSPELVATIDQLEARLSDLQSQIQSWLDGRQHGLQMRDRQDNEAWANLMGLLAAIQERLGALSRDRANAMAALQASQLLDDLEREMQQLRAISEDIATLQNRLRRSLSEREQHLTLARTRLTNNITIRGA